MSANAEYVRPIDQSVLDLLRQHRTGIEDRGLSVTNLMEFLDVTQTAVRQRLERLVEMDLVERTKQSVGRGRPQFRYRLTQLGVRYAAASYADLATALWQELMELPNPADRKNILARVAKRMGQGLKAQSSASDEVDSAATELPDRSELDRRLHATASLLNQRKVAASVNEKGALPMLEVHACPFPEIADKDQGRQLCEMEQEMLSEAVGESVHLTRCRLDGHDCCQFGVVNEGATPIQEHAAD